MTLTEIVRELDAMTEPRWITRENIDDLLDKRMIEIQMKGGNWWSCRRNGQTRRWKRDAKRIYVPFEYGFKFFGSIVEADFTNGPNKDALDTRFFRVKSN